jgi:hypothetical protein
MAALSIAVGIANACLYYSGTSSSGNLEIVWALTFVVLIAMWVEADSRSYPEVYRPYEFGFLAFLFWFAYLPYYLVRTRKATGLLWLLGLAALYQLGFILKLALYLGS